MLSIRTAVLTNSILNKFNTRSKFLQRLKTLYESSSTIIETSSFLKLTMTRRKYLHSKREEHEKKKEELAIEKVKANGNPAEEDR